MICVSLDERYPVKRLKRLRNIDFAEIRMEKMGLSFEDISEIFSQPVRLIATCRPGYSDDMERKARLLAAVESGARFVDIEVESDKGYKKEIVEAAEKNGCKTIISFHDFHGTPDNEVLRHIAALCVNEGADIVKIACMVNSLNDSARLLGLLGIEGFRDRLVVVGMGKGGRITRVVAPFLGSLFTYASYMSDMHTAEGQIEKTKLEEIVGYLNEKIG